MKFKQKDLVATPWFLALALQADGWFLRQDICWSKPNPMPESVTDRCTKAHEYIFLLSKNARYYFDQEAIREPAEYGYRNHSERWISGQENGDGHRSGGGSVTGKNPETGRNKRSVWTVPSAPYSEAHFATFPPDLIKPCILAGTSERGCCAKCGAPWERVVKSSKTFESGSGRSGNPINGKQRLGASPTNSTPDIRMGPVVSTKTTGWRPTCDCGESTTVPCTVLDCFAGSGTSGMVSLELGRSAILIELNPAYVKLAEKRCHITPAML